MNHAKLCACLAFVLLWAAATLSCSLPPSQATTQRKSNQNTVRKAAVPSELQMVGKVKVDEFNDQATGQEVPAKGGEILVRFNAEPQTLNTWLSTSDNYAQIIGGYMHNALLRQNPETFEWEGSLAARWIEEDIVVTTDGNKLRGVVSESHGPQGPLALKTPAGETLSLDRGRVKEVRKGASFTFYLRKDVRFHDGQPMTAADVKFSFDTIKNEHVDAPDIRIYFSDLESCEVLDKYTVRMTYSKQYWLARSVAGGFEILPKHLYDSDNLSQKDPAAFGKRFNESSYNRAPIGTGPYKFERWDTGQQVIVTRNDDYWDVPHRGYLDRIIFRFISDNVAALQALKNGEINFIPRAISAEQYDEETNDPEFLKKFVKVEYYTGGFCWTGWNMRRPPFNDPKVRLAMAYGALNREEFLEQVLHGHGIIVSGSEYYYGPAYDHSIQEYPYDPEKAKELLLEAGWYDRDGDGLRDKEAVDSNGRPYLVPFRFEHLLPSGSEVTRRRVALMKENLRKLGIDMTVRELEWATFIQNITDRKFDACYLCWATGIESDPYQIWHSSQSENRGSNYVAFGTPESDRIIEESRITLDDTARRKLFFQLHRIQHETQPYLFLYLQPELGAYDKKYRGVKLYKLRPGYDLSEWYVPQGGPSS